MTINRTEIVSTIELNYEDRARNVKYMKNQLHYKCTAKVELIDNVKFCDFMIQNNNWTITYSIPFDIALNYKIIYNKGGESWEYFHAIFKDLRMILLSQEDDMWFTTQFNIKDEEQEKLILKIKNEFYSPILNKIKLNLSDFALQNLMIKLSEI